MHPDPRPALTHSGPAHDHQDRHDRIPGWRAPGVAALGVGALLALVLAAHGAGLGPSFRGTLAGIAAALGVVALGFRAAASVLRRRVGAEIPPAVACLAAALAGEPVVAAGVAFVCLTGQYLEEFTLRRVRRSFNRMREFRPKKARVVREGEEVETTPEALAAGDRLVIRPGEKVAADGVIVAGRSAVDETMLDGAALPVAKAEGDLVSAGSVNHFGRLEVRVKKVGAETTLAGLIRLQDVARRRRGPLERGAEGRARFFLGALTVAAGAVFLATNAAGLGAWARAGRRPSLDWWPAVAVWLVASPRALLPAASLAVRTAMVRLAGRGVFVRGGDALERLAEVDAVAYGMSGALTEGRPELGRFLAFGGVDPGDVLRLAASAEQPSAHPIARMLVAAARGRGLRLAEVADYQEFSGSGVSSALFEGDGRRVLVGSPAFLRGQGLRIAAEAGAALDGLEEVGEAALLVAVDGRVVGAFGARDPVRAGAGEAIQSLRRQGLDDLTVLTANHCPAAARAAAGAADVGRVEAGLTPAGKAEWVRRRKAEGRVVAVVGDGVGDAPALAEADVGFALSRLGTDVSSAAGSVVVTGDPVGSLPEAVRLARRAVRVIRRNTLVFAVGLNGLGIALAGLRMIGPVGAALLNQLGSLLALWTATQFLGSGGWWGGEIVRGWGRFVSFLRSRRPSSWPGWVWERRRRLPLRSLAAAAVVGYLATGLTVIGPGEAGLVRQFGTYRPPALSPGLHWILPGPLESVTRVEPGLVRVAGLGGRGARQGPGGDGSSLFLTGDENLVELAAVVEYRLTEESAAELVFGVASVEPAVRAAAEGAFREAVARSALDDLLGAGRSGLEVEVELKLRDRLAGRGVPVAVDAVRVTEARPPREAESAYRDASAAVSDAGRYGNDARAYATAQVWVARAEARVRRDAASARGHRRKTRAEGDRLAFLARVSSHAARPDLTEFRLWWDTLAASLAGRPKLILDPKAGGRGHAALSDPGQGSAPGTPSGTSREE